MATPCKLAHKMVHLGVAEPTPNPRFHDELENLFNKNISTGLWDRPHKECFCIYFPQSGAPSVD